MISLVDQSASVTVSLGEKVTVRIEESLSDGLLWSYPRINGDGLSLHTSRSLTDEDSRIEYREFVFTTHSVGRNWISSSLKQAGISQGVKQLEMIVDVHDSNQTSEERSR